MSQEGVVRRLVARLSGQRLLDHIAVVEEKVGAFGRAQREALAAHGRQIETLQAGMSTRASAEAVRSLEQRVEAIQQQVKHQDRTVSEALERAHVLDDQGMDDRRFTRRIEELLRHERPVIVGPWTGEVGFELIYWVPFVRWVVQTYRIPPERLWVVSRGGTRAWYGDLAAHYVDAFEFCSPDDFRAATEEAKKQRRVGAFDAELTKRVTAALRSRAARPAASRDDVPAVHAVLEGSGLERTGRGQSCLCAADASGRFGGERTPGGVRRRAVLLQRVFS